jgi:hypothetical protein
MKTRIIKRWDKTCITKAFLLEFQLVAMETNTITLFLKETIVVEEKMEASVDVDALPMLEVVENYLQPTPTPPSTSVGPLGIVHKLHAQGRKKKIKLDTEITYCIYCWHYCSCYCHF